MNEGVERFVKSIDFLRELFREMDGLINPVMGISDWDDSVCVGLGGRKLLVSVDGPYTKRLVMKSALIHASTDVVVKGGRALFCLDALIGGKVDVGEMAESLRNQALAMEIPVLGGNTLFEDVDPRCSITVVGELITEEPIRDSGAEEDDVLVLIGEPIWGGQEERIEKAQRLFKAWYRIIDSGVRINASKDVTKGGLISTIYEMSDKSGREFRIKEDIPYPSTRNLDNFLLSIPKESLEEIRAICAGDNCMCHVIGSVE